jgi:hypothetical protein
MIVALHDPQRVGRHVLARDVPGFAAAALLPADADALALAQRVEGQADVLAHHAAVGAADRARRGRQVAVEELAERPLADEADAGRVFLLGVGQADLVGDAAHLALGQLAHRKQRLRELRLVQPMQEVALVLGRVETAQQLAAAALSSSDAAHARVVAGGDAGGAQRASRDRETP